MYRNISLTLLAGLFVLILFSSPALAWYDSGYTYRQNTTINQTGSGTISNVVYLINGTGYVNTSLLISQGKLQSDRDDIILVDSSESEERPYCFENKTSPIGSNIIWGYDPSVTTSNKTQQMYYGNTSVTSQENCSGVFSTSLFVGTYLFGAESGTIVYDKTGNSNDLTLANSGAWDSSGRIGYGIYVNKIETYAPYRSHDSDFDLPYDTTSWTITVCIKPDTSTPTTEDTVWEYQDVTETYYIKGRFYNNKMMFLYSYATGEYILEDNVLPNTNWRCYAFRYTHGTNTIQMYVNGVLQADSDTIGGNYYSSGNEEFRIGNDYWAEHGAGNRAFDGRIDNFFWWKKALSGDEIKRQHQLELSELMAEETSAAGPNITLTLGVNPDPLYNLSAANFSIFYNQSGGLPGDISINITFDHNASIYFERNYTGTAAGETVYYFVLPSNYSKHNNITLSANVTDGIGSTGAYLYKEIQNSVPSLPALILYPVSVIEGDNFTLSGNSTDADDDTLTYWYRFGWTNGTNITGWTVSNNLTVNSENYTYLVWAMADDAEVNGTTNRSAMNVTIFNITWPMDGIELIGKLFNFTFNISMEIYQPCLESVGGYTYDLGYLYTGTSNNTREVWYDNNTYTVSCLSLANSSLWYNKSVNFTNIFANWSVSMYTENDWNTPLNITTANLSIFINCEGGETDVYNFTGVTISGVKPDCDVQSITAKVDYATDSYTRERSVPDCRNCNIRMYMVDAMIYTVLQIPIYMSDYLYFDARIEIYKLSGGIHYTIAQGYFDVERKYVTYLTKDNVYYIRIDQGEELGNQIREIGYLYAAAATPQYLSLSEINLDPTIRLISDNILMAAAFDNLSANTSTLRIQYQDIMNMTNSVRIWIFSDRNNTAWYDNTISGSSNFTISLNDVNTTRHSIHFRIDHAVLGNSPIDFTMGVGGFLGIDLGFGSAYRWLYTAFAFVIMLFTAFIVIPEIRFTGYIVLIAEFGIFVSFGWIIFEATTVMLLLAILGAGFVYDIKYKGVT